MKVIDFARARIAWTTHDGSHGFWRVAAAARREDGEAVWFLAAGVLAGDVYGEDRLPVEPAYSFQFITSSERHVMLREPTGTGELQDTDAAHSSSFSNVAIETHEVEAEAVRFGSAASQRGWPLTARVAATGKSGARWLLDFPVNHINRKGRAFQVETGPVIVPADLIDVAGAAKPGGLQLAFVFFNRLDRVDLLAFGGGVKGRGYAHFGRLDGADIFVTGTLPSMG
jgi:hypothetical protein